MWEIESNADLLLINSYEVLNNIRPSAPTTVYLGGIHRKSEAAALSPSLMQFLDDSEQVVYVNLNSAIHQYPLRFKKLLAALENANIDVVWNLIDDNVNTSARIFQGSNLDQESVLGEFRNLLIQLLIQCLIELLIQFFRGDVQRCSPALFWPTCGGGRLRKF